MAKSETATAAADSPRLGVTVSDERQAMVLQAFWRLCRILPRNWAANVGAALLGVIGPLTVRNAKLIRNYRIAFPDRPEKELRRYARGSWRNFGRVLSEFPYMTKIYQGGPENAPFDYRFHPETKTLVDGGGPIIFVGGHISNWEYAALAVRLKGLPMSVVFSTLKTGSIDDAIRKEREAMDCGLIAKSDAIQRLWPRCT